MAARGRGERRAQAARAKDRSRRTWRVMDAQDGADTGRDVDPRWVGMRATTRTFATIEDRSGRGAHTRRLADLDFAEQAQNL